MAYVEDIGNQDVRSEGIGYAMMIAVQLDHQQEFDALWNFAASKMQIQSGATKDFFAWQADPTGKIMSTGIAPDGDEWIAAALAFAANRWGNGQGIYNYGPEAKQIVRAMWHNADSGGVNMFDSATGLPLFSPPGVSNFSDPSYCLPTFYTVFATLVPEDAALWEKASQGCRQLFQKASHPTTGLYPSYSNFDGTPNAAPWGGTSLDAYGRTFQEDAWRVIANVNMDAAWNGTQAWHTELSDRMATFFAARGITSYVSRYRLDGTPVVNGQNAYEPPHAEGLVAMNSTMAITSTHPSRLEFVRDFWNTKVPSGRARYYDGLLYMLGLLYDSGKFRVW
jgi:oligosaccharide reducing-end xylanase